MSSHPPASAPESAERRESISRIGVYGDLWMRYLAFGCRFHPPFLQPVTILLFTLVFFFIARRQRHAIARNLLHVLPGSSLLGNHLRSLRVFWNFAWNITDAGHVQAGQDVLDWEICGLEDFQRLQRHPGGVLVVTAHMGNYDVAAPQFSKRFGRKLHAVRLPEKHPALQAHMERTRDRSQSDSYQIHYNRAGNMLALELAQALGRGDVVAVQGDRVLGDVTALEVPVGEHSIRLPKGPFVLALAAQAPVYPLFILRTGWRRYQILVKPPLQPAPTPPRDREAAISALGTAWAKVLLAVAQEHWSQWFVLEDAFGPRRPSA